MILIQYINRFRFCRVATISITHGTLSSWRPDNIHPIRLLFKINGKRIYWTSRPLWIIAVMIVWTSRRTSPIFWSTNSLVVIISTASWATVAVTVLRFVGPGKTQSGAKNCQKFLKKGLKIRIFSANLFKVNILPWCYFFQMLLENDHWIWKCDA